MRDSNGPGELYIVQTPHCIESHPTVYKTGRACDSQERLRGYPKGTKLLCCIPVSRMRDGEAAMLGSCRGDARLEERKDFGSEYFEGDLGYLINKLASVAGLFKCVFRDFVTVVETEEEIETVDEKATKTAMRPETETVTEQVPVPEPHLPPEAEAEPAPPASSLDATLLLGAYIRSNIDELVKSPVDSGELLDRITTMLKVAGCRKKATPTVKEMTRDLIKYFGADEIMLHAFPDGGVRHAIHFSIKTFLPVQGTVHSNNPVTDWLDEMIEVTGVEHHFITVKLIKGKMKAAFCRQFVGFATNNFDKIVKNHIASCGGVFVGQTTILGQHVNKCFRGVRLGRAAASFAG